MSERREGDSDSGNDSVTTTRHRVDGTSLAVHCSGEGGPSVVLEAGLGVDSADWRAVQAGLARFARVCRYDRAGRGLSEPAQGSRDAHTLVDQLDALLRAAAVPAPYLLVGHSFGGLLARVYAARHPGRVAGIVLVDAMHEDQFDRMAGLFPPPSPGEPATLAGLRSFWQGGWRDPGANEEGIDLVTSLAQARAAGSLGDLPLQVLTAGAFLNEHLFPPPHGQRLQATWEQLHACLARLSANGRQRVVEDSRHYMQREQPDAVIDAVRSLVAPLR